MWNQNTHSGSVVNGNCEIKSFSHALQLQQRKLESMGDLHVNTLYDILLLLLSLYLHLMR